MGYTNTCICGFSLASILFLLFVGVPILFTYTEHGHVTEGPTFAVESAAMEAFEMTTDNRFFCIFGFTVGIHKVSPKRSVRYEKMEVEVRKGKHHKLARDAVGPLVQVARTDTTVYVEAVALFTPLEEAVAREMREDKVRGATSVNLVFFGWLGWSGRIEIRCRDVKVYFAASSGKFNRVVCDVEVYNSVRTNFR